jgi:hypothetical protein
MLDDTVINQLAAHLEGLKANSLAPGLVMADDIDRLLQAADAPGAP